MNNSSSALIGLLLSSLFTMGCSGSGGSSSVDSDLSEELTDAGIETLDEESSEALLEAVQLFKDALVADPSNDVARTLLALSEVLAFFDNPNNSTLVGSACGMDLETLLFRLDMELDEGATIFGFLDGTDPLPDPPDGMPSDPPTGTDIQSFFRCELIPLLQDTAASLEAVSLGFTHEFEEGLLGSEPFTIDHGDAHLIAGGLRGVEMAFHKLCIFELAIDPQGPEGFASARDGGDLPSQLFTGNDPFDVEPELLCGFSQGLFNSHTDYGTAGLLDASAEAQTHLDEWRGAAAQLLMNINDAVDGKAALEDAGAEPGLIEIDPTFMCAQGVWLPWLVDMVGALEGTDSSVAAVDVDDICGIEIHLPELNLPEELFEAATFSNRPFLPTITTDCSYVDSSNFGHLSHPAYNNLHALAAQFAEDGSLDPEDMFNVWYDMECAWENSVQGHCSMSD